jgi:UDP-N-acetylglucosamine 2-epimerase (non-hydrolysing)
MTILLVAGARPNFMKVAPIYAEFQRRGLPDVRVLLVHTGQHYDREMSEEFFEDLGLPQPDINLRVGSGTHAVQTARVMVAFEEVCLRERPDWVVVVGDVNSTLACALTAKKLGIRVAHVEAGLRSCDLSMPEEINRVCTDAISDLLFTTDRIASENLLREGVAPERIHFVGNTMIDSLLRHLDRARVLPLPEGLSAGNFAVLTLHRPANVDDPQTLGRILEAIGVVADVMPVAFPVHPRTARNMPNRLHPNVRLMSPLGYLRFLALLTRARLVMTDSGGIQEETTVLGVPCLTLRPNTERPITCEVGTNTVVGNDPQRIREAALCALRDGARRGAVPEKWDGRAAERIVEVLLNGHPVSG